MSLERLLQIAQKGNASSWGMPSPRKKPNRSGQGSEHSEQAALIRWCRENETRYPALRFLFAIPSGDYRSQSVANRLKLEGVKPGVPDLFLPLGRSIYHGLFVEMKRADLKPVRGGRGGVSDDQARWRLWLLEAGYRHAVCYGFEEARAEDRLP